MDKGKNLDDQLLKEAIRIGDMLLDKAQNETCGLSWETISVDTQNGIATYWSKEHNLYGGVSGICLFLAELYDVTNCQKYLDAAEKGMQWVLSSESFVNENSYSLITGRLGVTLVQIRLYEITNNAQYLEQALEIAKKSLSLTSSNVFEYISGVSGALLGLLQLHLATNDDEILNIIESFTEQLIKSIKLGEKGIFWDSSPNQVKSLCGFSHGVSGIAYVFLELGYYFNNPVFYQVSQQAFIYENQFYDKTKKNWLDLRNVRYESTDPIEYLEAYKKGDMNFFLQTNDMNAWCHGAAGIGLSRVRACERIKHNTTYIDDFRNSVSKTLFTDLTNNFLMSPTLCHGNGGNAELFIEAYQMFGDDVFLQYAYEIAKNVLLTKEKVGIYVSGTPNKKEEDLSLYLGTAGVGYFFLRLITKGKIASVLAIKTKSKCTSTDYTKKHFLNINPKEIHLMFLKSSFSRTLCVMKEVYKNLLDDYLDNNTNTIDFKDSWTKFMSSILDEHIDNKDFRLREIFKYESFLTSLNELVESDRFISYKRKMILLDSNRLNRLSQSTFLIQELVIDSDLVIFETKWNWSNSNYKYWSENLIINPENHYSLICPTYKGTEEWLISPFSSIVLQAFELKTSVVNAIDFILTLIDYEDQSSEEEMYVLVVQQIKIMINSGWLVDPEMHLINFRKVDLYNIL